MQDLTVMYDIIESVVFECVKTASQKLPLILEIRSNVLLSVWFFWQRMNTQLDKCDKPRSGGGGVGKKSLSSCLVV